MVICFLKMNGSGGRFRVGNKKKEGEKKKEGRIYIRRWG